MLHPPTSADGPKGLASDVVDQAKTFIVRTDLSTTTRSNAMLDGTTPLCAYLLSPADFLMLTYEASVSGSQGYYLNYATSSGAGCRRRCSRRARKHRSAS